MRAVLSSLACCLFISAYGAADDVVVLGRVDVGSYEVRILRASYGDTVFDLDFEIVCKDRKTATFSLMKMDDVQDIRVLADGKAYSFGRLRSAGKVDEFKDSLDFDKDGASEVVVETIVAGQGCCSAFYVFKVSPALKVIGQLSSSRYGDIGDLDDDGETEISVADGTFMTFEKVCHADSPILYVPHHLVKGRFVPDIAAMKNGESSTGWGGNGTSDAVDAFARARSSGANTNIAQDVPPVIWVPVVQMWYRGDTAQAREYFDLVWPEEVSGKEDFWKTMLAKARKSPYWDALKKLNGWE